MEDRCIVCGETIPEGRQVCVQCQLASESAPCFGCRDRTKSCHTYCKAYTMYHEATDRAREIRNRKYFEDEYFIKRTEQRKAVMRRKGDLK